MLVRRRSRKDDVPGRIVQGWTRNSLKSVLYIFKFQVNIVNNNAILNMGATLHFYKWMRSVERRTDISFYGTIWQESLMYIFKLICVFSKVLSRWQEQMHWISRKLDANPIFKNETLRLVLFSAILCWVESVTWLWWCKWGNCHGCKVYRVHFGVNQSTTYPPLISWIRWEDLLGCC